MSNNLQREKLGENKELILIDAGRGRWTEKWDYESNIEEVAGEQIVYRDKPYIVEKVGKWNKVSDGRTVEVLGIVEEGPYTNTDGENEVTYRELQSGEDSVKGYLEEGEPDETDLCNLLGWR